MISGWWSGGRWMPMFRPEATAQQPPEPAVGAADYSEPPASPLPRWGWLSSPAVQGLLAFAVYAAVWLSTVFRPLVSHLGRAQVMQSSPDPNFYVWGLGWWSYAITHGVNPLFTHLIEAPAGTSLGWVTTVPPLGLAAAPITLAAGPVVAFNLLTALALPLSAWAAFLACRRLTGRFWPALMGGAVYGFSDYEFRHVVSGQLNLCFAVLPPILVYLVVRWRDGAISNRVLVILAGLVMAVQFYLFLETFADLTAILVLALLLGLAVADQGSRRRVLRLAGLLGLAYLIALALAAPYLAVTLSTASPRTPPHGAMDLASLWLPTQEGGIGVAWLSHAGFGPHEASPGCSVGIPLLIVVVVLAATRWRSRIVWFLTGLFVVLAIGALGPIVYVDGHREFTVPWHHLFTLPIVRNAYPTRLMLFGFLILALATALLLAGPTGERQPGRWQARWSSLTGRWGLAALVIAFGVVNVPTAEALAMTPQTTVPAFISSGEYQHWLRHGEVVMVVSNVGNAGLLWQADSRFYWRLAGGYINQGFDKRTGMPVGAQNLPWPTPSRIRSFEALIRTDHLGAILVDSRHIGPWTRVFGIFGLTGHLTGDVMVYQTHGCQTCRRLSRAQVHAAMVPSSHQRPG